MRASLRLAPLLLTLALSLFAGTASPQPAANPVSNPGFEQVDPKVGLPLDWAPWSQGNLCAYTLAVAHSGVASAMVTDDDATVSQGLRCKPVPVEPGKTYEAHGWVKISDLKAGGFAVYLEYWNGTERVHNVAVSCSEVGEWKQLRVSAPAPPEATTATVIIYGSSATVGVAYFDDVAITLKP